MPRTEFVGARGNIGDSEKTCIVGAREPRVRQHEDDTRHPGVDGAEYFHSADFRKHHRLALFAVLVEAEIKRRSFRDAKNVVENVVGIGPFDDRACDDWKYVRHERSVALDYRTLRGRLVRGREGFHVADADHEIAQRRIIDLLEKLVLPTGVITTAGGIARFGNGARAHPAGNRSGVKERRA